MRDHSRISLWIYHHMADHNTHRPSLINIVDHPTALKILGKLLPEHPIMLWRQSYSQIYLFKSGLAIWTLKLFCDSKQCQYEVVVVPCLIPHIGEPLSRKCPVTSSIFQNLLCHRRLHLMFGQAGDKGKVRCFNRIVAMINCNQHNIYLLFIILSTLHAYTNAFTTKIRFLPEKRKGGFPPPFPVTVMTCPAYSIPRHNHPILYNEGPKGKCHTETLFPPKVG